MKVLITGAGGFLGSRLCKKLENHEIIACTRSDADITDRENVLAYLTKHKPDAVIHCAALSDVAACQNDPDLSYRINVLGTEHIALACLDLAIKLIFCSSDQVYVGLTGQTAHLEDETINPPHPYGQHKVLAENHCRRLCQDSVSLRLAWMYDAHVLAGEGRGGLTAQVAEDIKKGLPLQYPDNDYRSITNVWEVVSQMEKALTLPGGIYNFGSENEASTYGVVRHILYITRHDEMKLSKKQAPKPGDSRNIRMNTEKAQALGVDFYETLDGLNVALAHLL